jgi:formylglycine-generating enzyme required for sulfatase activity
MGSPQDEPGRDPGEGPQREVEISKPFYLGRCEVTQGQYEQVMRTNPSYFAPQGLGRTAVRGLDTREFPVDSVSWEEAVDFCRRLSARPEEKEAGRAYDLPTEAEWEYACRAGTRMALSFGPLLDGRQANCDGHAPYGTAAQGPSLGRTCAAGACYPANAWGLCDMHGNVWEWCKDRYDKDYYSSGENKDPQGTKKPGPHVLRGGSWYNSAAFCRCACRYPDSRDPRLARCVGFRVALRVE